MAPTGLEPISSGLQPDALPIELKGHYTDEQVYMMSTIYMYVEGVFICVLTQSRAPRNRTEFILFPKQADYHLPRARGP